VKMKFQSVMVGEGFVMNKELFIYEASV